MLVYLRFYCLLLRLHVSYSLRSSVVIILSMHNVRRISLCYNNTLSFGTFGSKDALIVLRRCYIVLLLYIVFLCQYIFAYIFYMLLHCITILPSVYVPLTVMLFHKRLCSNVICDILAQPILCMFDNLSYYTYTMYLHFNVTTVVTYMPVR